MRTQQDQAKEAQPQDTDPEPTLAPVESGGAQRGPHAEELADNTTAKPTGEVNAQSGQALPRWSQHGAIVREARGGTIVPQHCRAHQYSYAVGASRETVSEKPSKVVRGEAERARRQWGAADGRCSSRRMRPAYHVPGGACPSSACQTNSGCREFQEQQCCPGMRAQQPRCGAGRPQGSSEGLGEELTEELFEEM